MYNPIDPNAIGQGRSFPEPVNAYDASAGKYSDALPSIPTDAKLPTQQMPLAPMGKPFALKIDGTGER